MASRSVFVYKGEALARYGFGDAHPFGIDRHDVFHAALGDLELKNAVEFASPRRASVDEIAMFHTPEYIELVRQMSEEGNGYLDGGDTPVVPGIFDCAADVVGTTLAATDAVMSGAAARAFVPIAGLHHAARDGAAGFCVFNDCGIAIEYLRREHRLSRIAYVDIDAHHGDGVYYGFEDDPDLLFADIHEDGRFLYPGTGAADETGTGVAEGTKLNIPMPPGANDEDFARAWPVVESFIDVAAPEFIILQCGADSVQGDPLTHMAFSPSAHATATARLCKLADRHCDGRIVATGGGGYNRANLAAAWVGVVDALVNAS